MEQHDKNEAKANPRATFVICLVYALDDLHVLPLVASALLCSKPSFHEPPGSPDNFLVVRRK
jgi:hypothetical protein